MRKLPRGPDKCAGRRRSSNGSLGRINAIGAVGPSILTVTDGWQTETVTCCTLNATPNGGENTLPRTRKQIEQIAIDKNIEPPKTRTRSGYGLTAESMEPGDSVFFSSRVERQRMIDAFRYRGIRYASRKTENGLGWRIWRLT
jgi:hypothetical protein